MQIHQVKKPASLKSKKRVARGGKRGTYSGRGMDGQKSRSGGNIRPGFEGKDTTSVSRTPKIAGFTSPNLPNEEVSLDVLEKKFKSGDKVNPNVLKKEGIINLSKRGRARRRAKIKILSNGTITKKLTIEGCLTSKSARKAVEKAGGKVIEEKKTKKGKK